MQRKLSSKVYTFFRRQTQFLPFHRYLISNKSQLFCWKHHYLIFDIFLHFPIKPPNIDCPKISENQYISTFNRDIYKELEKKFQDLLYPKVEFVRWCTYFELETLNWLHKLMWNRSEQNCLNWILIYISHFSHIPWNPHTNKW